MTDQPHIDCDDDETIEAMMTSVASFAREESEDAFADPRWAALAEGSLDAASRQELAALHPEAVQMFEPIDTSKRADYARAANDALGASATPTRQLAEATRSSWRQWLQALLSDLRMWGAMGAFAAAAAAVFLMVGEPSMTPMPRYVLSVQGGPADMRGEPEDSPTHQLVTGRAFTALIRPETDVAGPVAAHAYWQVGDRQIPAELQLDVSHQGAVRVKGTAVALDTREQSPVQLFILIASPEVLKGITADANSLGDVDASGQVSVHRLSVVTAGPE